MLRGFPNKDKLTAGYAGAMAEIFMSYPKAVAVACADPIDGVVRGLKFMPVPSDVIAWCENRQRPIMEQADREVRVKRQVQETDAWVSMKVPESLKAKGKAWLDRSDPVAVQVSGQTPKTYTAAQRAKLIEDARATGKSIAGMSLRPETLATLQKWQLKPTAREIPGPSFNQSETTAASQRDHQSASASDDVDFGLG